MIQKFGTISSILGIVGWFLSMFALMAFNGAYSLEEIFLFMGISAILILIGLKLNK